MKYTLSWKDDRRGECLIELWQEGNWWRWFFRPADIAFYQQGSGQVKLKSMKKYLRENFYPPRSVKFCLTQRPPDVGQAYDLSGQIQLPHAGNANR